MADGMSNMTSFVLVPMTKIIFQVTLATLSRPSMVSSSVGSAN
jgi:hypothetical protein